MIIHFGNLLLIIVPKPECHHLIIHCTGDYALCCPIQSLVQMFLWWFPELPTVYRPIARFYNMYISWGRSTSLWGQMVSEMYTDFVFRVINVDTNSSSAWQQKFHNSTLQFSIMGCIISVYFSWVTSDIMAIFALPDMNISYFYQSTHAFNMFKVS